MVVENKSNLLCSYESKMYLQKKKEKKKKRK